jgi:hypothetical protein
MIHIRLENVFVPIMSVQTSSVRLAACMEDLNSRFWEIRSKGFLIGLAKLIVDFDAEHSDSLDADLCPVVPLAIDGQKQIGDKSREDLHQQSVI